MKDICPFCGHEQVVSYDPIPFGPGDNPPLVEGIEHLVCPHCAEVEFTPEQLEKLPASETLAATA